MPGKSDNLVQSVDRALIIMEKLAEEKNGLGVTSLAKATGFHKSTVHRLLGTLMNRGYVGKEVEGDKYRLGNKILFLANSILGRMDVKNVSAPYIRKLADSTHEVVHLSILDGDEAVYIDKVESENINTSIRMNSQIGKRVPLYCTAVGKVLVLDYSEETIRGLIREECMVKFTKNTITNIEDFILQVQKVKEQGFAFDEMEHEEGIRCIAAPIYNRDGKVTAAVSVSGLTIIMTEDKIPEIKREVIKTAEQISYQLGYIGE